MKPSALAKLSVVLVVLGALAGAAWYASRPASHPRLVDASAIARIDRVEFEGPDGRCDLVKTSGAWKMQSPVDYPASSKDLQEALDKLPTLDLSDELSNDAAGLELFGLSPSSETVVRLFAGADPKPTLEFSIGKEGPDWDSFFLRLPGRGAVLAQGLPSRDIKKPAGDWLAKTVTNYPADAISRLSVRTKSAKVELKKEKQGWIVAGRPVPADSLNSLLKPAVAAAAAIDAEHVLPAKSAPPAKTMGLEKPEMTIEFTGPSNVTLKVGAKGADGGRYVKRVGEDRVYFVVADWKFDPLRKNEFATIGRPKVAKKADKEPKKEARK